jgi:hypothetical protein
MGLSGGVLRVESFVVIRDVQPGTKMSFDIQMPH